MPKPKTENIYMSDLNTLIGAHWNAKAALEAAKLAEQRAREALSAFLCKDEDSIKNKTLPLQGGWKLKQEVSRSLRVNKSHEDYKHLSTILTPAQLNAVVKQKQLLDFSYSGYKALPTELHEALSPFITVVDSVAIKYEQIADAR